MDIISGDEMVSDSYPYILTFDDAALEVKSRLITKNANENFGIEGKLPSPSPAPILISLARR